MAVQRVYADASVYDALLIEVVAAVVRLGTGAPENPHTVVGPLINTGAADRIQGWVAEAVAGGAIIHAGGGRDGTTLEPTTVLTGVPRNVRLSREEISGPVPVIEPAADLTEAAPRAPG